MAAPEEFESRPRLRLLELLERRELDLGQFALRCEMAGVPETWSSERSLESEHLHRARVALRGYTHGRPDPDRPGERRYYKPGSDLICRWARELGVDPGYFYSRGRPRDFEVSRPSRRRARNR